MGVRDSKPSRSAEAVAADDAWAEFLRELNLSAPVPFAEQWRRFEAIHAHRRAEDGPAIAWRPDPAAAQASNLGRLIDERGLHDFAELHAWSKSDRAGFWRMVICRLGIRFRREPEQVLNLESGPTRPRWLVGARLNIVDSCFQTEPERPAIIYASELDPRPRTMSYGELEVMVNRVANGLRDRGYREGAAIALFLPMTPLCVAAYLGVVRAGCRVVSIPDSFSAPEVTRRLQLAAASAIITVSSWVRGGRELSLYTKVKAALAGYETPCRAIVIPSENESESAGLREGDVGWDELLASSERFSALAADPEDVTNILFSSGTTGDPKAIPWTHLTPIKCAMDGHFHHDIRPHDVVAWPTNIGWMMGPWLIYATFVNRATMALFVGSPAGADFTRFVRAADVSVLGVVPALVRAWRDSAVVGDGEWSRVRVLSSTGEPSNREDYLWLMSRTGYRAPVIEYLGGTEIGGAHVTGTVVQEASPSAFTTPALGLDVVILDEHGDPVEEGEMGEMFLVPPAIGMSDHLLNGDNHQVYYEGVPPLPDGTQLRRHGDQMLRLHQGFFRAQGRADDTMNLGGIKVSSVELERVVNRHPAVYESAAVGVQPGGEGAEVLVLFVVARSAVSTRELTTALNLRIASELNPLYKIHELRLVAALPRTASGKLMRRTLRANVVQSA